MSIEKQKDRLVEMFGVHFENLYHLPPLSSRILGILIVDGCHKGITFEELVDITMASKSSVSTSLSLLVKLERITYYTVAGDRKKYYKPAPFSNRLANYLNVMDLEKKIIVELLSYREKSFSCSEEMVSIENLKAYQSHINDVEKVLQKTINKFKQIEEINKNNA